MQRIAPGGRCAQLKASAVAEIRYLADLARAWADGRPGSVPPPADLDRDRFLRRLAGLPAAPALAAYLDLAALPAADRERFRRALGFARQRTTLLLLELERILPAFADAGCRPVALKGAGLALGNYLRPEDRWFIDLDLLVTREELPQAYNALERVGYRFHDTARSSRYYEEHHFHRILRNAQGIFLEVHWAVTLPASVYTFDLEALRRDAVERPLGRTTVRTPSARDQILHGVLQSIAGGYSDLRRILDLHLLDAALGDRMQLAAYATHHNLATGLWLQYRLREELMDVAMPREIVDRCAPPPRVGRLLANLDIAGGCLTERVRHQEGYDNLVHWLCVPAGARAREVRRFLHPDVGGLLEAGFPSSAVHDPWRRLRLSLHRLSVGARILGYLGRAAAG